MLKNKRNIIILICVILIIVIACIIGGKLIGNKNENSNSNSMGSSNNDVNDNSDNSTKDNSNNVIESDEYESSEILLVENLYDEDNETYRAIKEIQGKISAIGDTGDFPVLLEEKTLYLNSYGTLKSVIEFSETPDEILFFDNMNIGENVFFYKDGKISCYDLDSEARFENIDFDTKTDFIPEIKSSASLYIISKTSEGYTIKYYGKENSSKPLELYSEKSLEEIITKDGEKIDMKELVVIKNNIYGYSIYCITNDNDVYQVDEIEKDSIEMATKAPIITNVDKIYQIPNVGTNLTLPIYSKIGDETAVYSGAPGASLMDTSDNFEISFTMPDGHKASEIKDIFQVSGSLIFVFENGDTYITDEIEEEDKNIYEMTKLEAISELNSEGKIVDMAGSEIFNDNIYILMDNGKLYYSEVK